MNPEPKITFRQRTEIGCQKLIRNTVFQMTFWALLMIALIIAWFGDAFQIVRDVKHWFGK